MQPHKIWPIPLLTFLECPHPLGVGDIRYLSWVNCVYNLRNKWCNENSRKSINKWLVYSTDPLIFLMSVWCDNNQNLKNKIAGSKYPRRETLFDLFTKVDWTYRFNNKVNIFNTQEIISTLIGWYVLHKTTHHNKLHNTQQYITLLCEVPLDTITIIWLIISRSPHVMHGARVHAQQHTF